MALDRLRVLLNIILFEAPSISQKLLGDTYKLTTND